MVTHAQNAVSTKFAHFPDEYDRSLLAVRWVFRARQLYSNKISLMDLVSIQWPSSGPRFAAVNFRWPFNIFRVIYQMDKSIDALHSRSGWSGLWFVLNEIRRYLVLSPLIVLPNTHAGKYVLSPHRTQYQPGVMMMYQSPGDEHRGRTQAKCVSVTAGKWKRTK